MDLKVFITTSNKGTTCGGCEEKLWKGAWITLVKDKDALCLSCADIDHLVYLPSGNAALTRRSKRDLISTEFLRSAYGAVKRRLRGAARKAFWEQALSESGLLHWSGCSTVEIRAGLG